MIGNCRYTPNFRSIKRNILNLSFKALYFTCVQDDVQVAQRYTEEVFAKKRVPRSPHRTPALTPRGARLAQRLRSPSSHGSGHGARQKPPLPPLLSLTAYKQGLGAPKPALRVSAARVC